MSSVARTSASRFGSVTASFLARGVCAAAMSLTAGCSQDVTRFDGMRLDFLGEALISPEKKEASVPGDGKWGIGSKDIKESSLPPVKKTVLDDSPAPGPSRWDVKKAADYDRRPERPLSDDWAWAKGKQEPPSPWAWANGKEIAPPEYVPPQLKPSFQGHYTTRRGDTLAGIAERYKVSLSELKRVNGIQAGESQVKAGTVLAIPSRGTAPPRVVQVKPATGGSKVASVAPPPVLVAPPKLLKKIEKTEQGGEAGAGQEGKAPLPETKRSSPPETKASPPEAKVEPKEAGTKDATTTVRFRWPLVSGGKVISTFGPQPDGSKNEGIKLEVPLDTDIQAVESGRVHYAGDGLKGYGNLILIRHPNGWVSTYAHASKMLVKVGDDVQAGQVIAKSGQTGPVDVPQLGFELRKGSVPVNPLEYLKQ